MPDCCGGWMKFPLHAVWHRHTTWARLRHKRCRMGSGELQCQLLYTTTASPDSGFCLCQHSVLIHFFLLFRPGQQILCLGNQNRVCFFFLGWAFRKMLHPSKNKTKSKTKQPHVAWLPLDKAFLIRIVFFFTLFCRCGLVTHDAK